MPLPGGPANKLPNRYENWWTVWQLVRMLEGAYESIRIEVPGVDEAEFVLRTKGVQEWHQVKRSHRSGKWTIAGLASPDLGLLQAIGNRLDGNSDRFVFVSASDAGELTELSDRARQATTLEEFQTAFLRAKEHGDRFAQLQRAWNGCDVRTAHDRLRRIQVHTISERLIEELARSGITVVYLGRPSDLIAALRTIAEDSVHVSLTRDDLIAKLTIRGFAMRRVAHPDSALAAVGDASRRYLESVRGKLIRRTLVPRPETQLLLGILGATPTRHVVLTGKAGSGKTGCVIEFVDELRSRSVPVLALRLDRIAPASTARDLGERVGLEESPALVLAAAAGGREAVLVIDQLDAISTASGRSTGVSDAIEGILTETSVLRERANIHVVVVCREFDWANDHRLKRLLAEKHDHVSVDVFPVDCVRELLAAEAFEPALFGPRQIELLRLPQNLSMFLDAQFDHGKTPMFNTTAELLGRYWDAKRRAVRERVGGSADCWMQVINILVEEMARTQQLSARREKLDSIDPACLDQMSSEGVLAFDGRRYGFGHESFFDYCFARSFCERQGTIVEILTSREQHLFRRSQVRQVLTYLRDADRTRYLRELSSLLTDVRVRAHIKDLVLSLLGSVDDPSEDEWAVWESLLGPMLGAIEASNSETLDRLAALAWRHLFRSPSWFALTVGKGIVARWLAADACLANVAVNLLRVHARHAGDVVAELLEPYVDCGSEWPARLRSIVEWNAHTTSRRLFDLILRLIDNGALDDARAPMAANGTFWLMFHQTRKLRPGWVAEVIARWLRRRIAVLAPESDAFTQNNVFGRDDFAHEPMQNAATRAPHDFVKCVLPVVLDLSDRAAQVGAAPPRRDTVWRMLTKGDRFGADSACLTALGTALGRLSRDGHDLRSVIDELSGRDTYVANYLLQMLYAANADQYADEAAEILADEPWRFDCGYYDSSHWTSIELVRVIAPRCDPELRTKLEAAIIAYVAPWEHGKHSYRSVGFASFSILSAFPSALRSSRGRVRFFELERKFSRPAEAPRPIKIGPVQPPIGKDATEKMTDEQWLSAMRTYRSDRHLDRVRDGSKGGAGQIAQSLEPLVMRQPERFARLALRMPADLNPIYLDSILTGLKKSAMADDLRLAVCRKAFTDAREPCGQSLADVLGESEAALPQNAVQMLVWLATEHSSPSHDKPKADGAETSSPDRDLYGRGINTTRGRAALAIGSLVWRDARYAPLFRDALERMVHDRSPCVRACVGFTLQAIACHDTEAALAFFGRMDTDDERLLVSVHVYAFVKSLLRDHWVQLRSTVERMLRSRNPDVAQGGGRLAGLAALYKGSVMEFDEQVAGDVWHRRGLAEVAATHVALEQYRTWCEGHLIRAFNDVDEDVRKAAAASFAQLTEEPLESFESLIMAFVGSLSYRDDSLSLLHLLENSIQRLPAVTCVVCEKFLERFSEEASDLRTRRAYDAHTVTKLVFRTYQQHQDGEWPHRTLDLIDRLCFEGIDDARDELEAFER